MPFHTLTPLEDLAVAYVHAAQRSFAPSGPASATLQNGAHELSITVDRAGASHIDRQIFGPHGGQISPAVLAAIRTPTVGCRIIHNHPAQGSLSASDWRLMAGQQPGLEEMIAVNSRGSQFRGKVVTKNLSAFTAAVPTSSEPSTIVEGKTSSHTSVVTPPRFRPTQTCHLRSVFSTTSGGCSAISSTYASSTLGGWNIVLILPVTICLISMTRHFSL